MVSGGHCVSPFGSDYSNCTVRCWGYGFSGDQARERDHLEAQHYIDQFDNTDSYRRADLDSSLATDVWEYPKGLFSYSYEDDALEYRPQGHVFTLAGGQGEGRADGVGAEARFSRPQDVAVDFDRNVYVADTGNHAIRRISPDGVVRTVIGQPGKAGSEEGNRERARFSSPSGISVFYDWTHGNGTLTLFVADTGNHRIRRIVLPNGTDDDVYVGCFAGRCGNGTISYTATQTYAPPQPGLADGWSNVARFDSPRGIDVGADGSVYVADTNNHLVRKVNQSGFVTTLAGNIEVAEANADGEPLEGCPPPCLRGVPGYRDGNVTFARFYFPSDVAAVNTNGTRVRSHGEHAISDDVIVTDQHRLRRITPANARTTVQGVTTTGGRVVTLAGQREEGERDGEGDETEFNQPDGVAIAADGSMYIVDAVSCRLRRASPAANIAQNVTCSSVVTSVIRPSGCASYDPPVDDRDMKVSVKSANTHYNHLQLDTRAHKFDGEENEGRSIKNCVGSPPPDRLDKEFQFITGGNLVVDDERVDVEEDSGDGSTIRVRCPAGCQSTGTSPRVWGTKYYTDDSRICEAALHAGAIDSAGGLVTITLERGLLSRNDTYRHGSSHNGVTSGTAPHDAERLVSMSLYPEATVEVQTIAGYPAALLTGACGFRDGQPPQEVRAVRLRVCLCCVRAVLPAITSRSHCSSVL